MDNENMRKILDENLYGYKYILEDKENINVYIETVKNQILKKYRDDEDKHSTNNA